MDAFSVGLRALVATSNEPPVGEAETALTRLAALADSMPATYGMRQTTVEGLGTQLDAVAKAGKAAEVTKLYLIDQCRGIEAYGLLTVWRAVTLAEDVTDLLNRDRAIGPAILARSLLELSVRFLHNVNRFRKYAEFVEGVPAHGVPVSQEIEILIERALYSSSRPPEDASHLRAEHITPQIRLLSSLTECDPAPIYALLCDLAHPNGQGYGQFYVSSTETNTGGVQVVRLARREAATTADIVRLATLWVLGWASTAVANGWEINQDVVGRIMARAQLAT